MKSASMIESVPWFKKSVLDSLFCGPCHQAELHRAPSAMIILASLKLLHLDISGPNIPSIAGSTYTVSYLDDFTAKSDVLFIRHKAQLYPSLLEYKARAEV